MKRHARLAGILTATLAAVTLVLGASSVPAAAAATTDAPACQTYTTCFDIGVLAYTYAYPLVMVGVTERVATNVPNATTTQGRAPVNQFSYNKLPTAAYTDIVLPNVNTPYAVAWLNLRKEPMILRIPDVRGRFFLMESMDAWTDVIPNSPGTRTMTKPGYYAYVGPDWKGALPSGLAGVFRFPTNTVFIAGRTYTTGSQQDIAKVFALQRGYKLIPLSKFGKPYRPPTNVPYDPHLNMTTPYVQVNEMSAGTFFSTFARLWRSNPPLPTDAAVVRQLAKIGLVPGRPFDINRLNPVTRQALQAAAAAANKAINKLANRHNLTTTNWSMSLNLGQYGRRYLLRALVARGGLGANYFKDAVYAGATEDGAGQTLNGSRDYTLTFAKGDLPPANPQAFWSVTLYNVPGLTLFANPINRNALGIPAVQNHLPCFNADGSLTFYIQAAQPDPTTEPTQYCNWLPAPAGNFVLLLRIYWPGDELFDGQWIPPAVQQTTSLDP